MIKQFRETLDQPKALILVSALQIAMAVLQGGLIGMLLPVFRALLQMEPDFGAAAPWLIVEAVCLLVYVSCILASTPAAFAASMEVTAQIRRKIIEHTVKLCPGWFSAENKVRLSRAVTGYSSAIGTLSVTYGAQIILDVAGPVVLCVFVLFIGWYMILPLVIGIPVLLAIINIKNRRYAYIEENLEEAARRIADDAIDFGRAQAVLRAAGKKTGAEIRLEKNIDDHRRVFQRGLNAGVPAGLLCMAIPICAFFITLVFGINRLLQGSLPLSDAVVLFIICVRYVLSLGMVVENSSVIGFISKALGRILEILHAPTLPDAPDPVTLLRDGSIEFNDVTFSYEGSDRPVLRNLSFVCPAGSTTALIGPSGAGKTTTIKLIPRFFDVTGGSLRIGGIDVRDYDHRILLRNVSIIFQDVYLFSGAIEENLRLARPDATMAELEAAARSARLDEVIARLPQGWQTTVGEGGARLSGGERQRVSIARAFLKKAPIVLIDEAVSALDGENERAIAHAIAELAKDPGRTVIVIAHHPATLAAADRVIALVGGQVAETGSPEELRESGGIFANLYAQYKQARGWRIGKPA
jgi:ATP-binding cassette subfamily B protein